MNKLLHVIRREYMTRVRKTSFILITLLTPFLLATIFLLPAFFATQHENYKELKIGLIDPLNSLKAVFEGSELSVKRLENKTAEDIKNFILTDKWDGIIYIEKFDSARTIVQYYSRKKASVFLLNQIRSTIQKVVINDKLAVFGIENSEEFVNSAMNSVVIESFKVSAETTERSSFYQQMLCMALGAMIYLFIFLFASQVMRGVMEEKSSRIVELIITSISPVKFMTGKIIGIALLGLTQIICWLVIIYGVILLLYSSFGASLISFNLADRQISPDDINQILNNLNLIDFNTIIPAFVFFFICGYLLYSSIFAAIAAAANHEDDVQQTMLIATIPLISSIIVLSNTMISPDSSLSYWFSIIPFTSPIVMMGRIVQGAPILDILLSILLLIATVAGTITLSGKVYRAAILYNGKKVTLKDTISWISK